jgi:hypothetical protein
LIAEKENLCLYGLPNETWEVNLPAEEVPPELPEPALGINFARDGMDEKDWLSLVAVHSDAWLLAVAFYFGARFGFDKESRYFIHLMFVSYFSLWLHKIFSLYIAYVLSETVRYVGTLFLLLLFCSYHHFCLHRLCLKSVVMLDTLKFY